MYTWVALRLAWPKISLMANRLAPLLSMWVAKECLNTWGEVLDAWENSFRYLFTKRYTSKGYKGSPLFLVNRYGEGVVLVEDCREIKSLRASAVSG